MMHDHEYRWSEDSHEITDIDFTEWLAQDPSRAVTFIAPGGDLFGGFDAPLTVQVLPSEPAVAGEAESVADFDLVAPSGRVDLAPSGGMEGLTTIAVPPGQWRARWSGFGETAATEKAYPTDVLKGTDRPDRYLLQLWPLDSPAPVVVRR
jgi:hypothetical protein